MLIKNGYSKQGRQGLLYRCYWAYYEFLCSRIGVQWGALKSHTKQHKKDVSLTISLNDMQFKKVIAFTHLLLDDVFYDTVPDWESQLEQWTSVIGTFNKLNKLMCSRVEFTDKMIEEFQNLADSFFTTWVSLNGMARVTNYIQMLGSGHLTEFYISTGTCISIHSKAGNI